MSEKGQTRMCKNTAQNEAFFESNEWCEHHNYDFDASLLAFLQPRQCGNCKFWDKPKGA